MWTLCWSAEDQRKKLNMSDKTAIAATASTYTGSAGLMATGVLTTTEWLGICGVGIALATFFVNWYYRHKSFKLEEKKVGQGGASE